MLIAYVGMPPFVVTLGMLSIARSLAMVLLATTGWSTSSAPTSELLAAGRRLLDAAAIAESRCIVLVPDRAAVRRRLRVPLDALGPRICSRSAATSARRRLTGVPVKPIKVSVYMLSALTAGIAGILEVGWLGTVTTGLGQAMELSVIAAAVIGGANLDGRHRHGLRRGGRRGADRGHPQQPDAARHQHLLAGPFVGTFIIVAVLFDRLRGGRAAEE